MGTLVFKNNKTRINLSETPVHVSLKSMKLKMTRTDDTPLTLSSPDIQNNGKIPISQLDRNRYIFHVSTK